MIRLGKESKHSAEQVLERAVKFFGPNGVGLDLKVQSEGFIRFEGSGGYVEVSVEPKGKHAEVDIVAIEWDHQARQFLGKI